MTPLQKKYQDLTPIQIDGMINYCIKKFPYLEFTSHEVLRLLISYMITLDFMFEGRSTPVMSSLVFLREVGNMEAEAQGQRTRGRANVIFAERDFVFAIKLFSLPMRQHNGVIQFIGEEDEENIDNIVVELKDVKGARQLEFYLSEAANHTKIQLHSIESATNRLRRDFREVELCKIFAALIAGGMKVGEARTKLRTEYDIKDHEFVRIREHAVSRGIFVSKRKEATENRRITLDEDIALMIENLSYALPNKGKPLTMSATVNQVLRDFATDKNIPIPQVPFAQSAGDHSEQAESERGEFATPGTVRRKVGRPPLPPLPPADKPRKLAAKGVAAKPAKRPAALKAARRKSR